MCGFVGRIIADPGLPRPSFNFALPWIARRGPDSQQIWSSERGEIELLHARLAIVDKTSVAHQPLTDRQNRVTVVFVGEVYNHRDLRNDLAPRKFSTNSDTEVLLALYLRDGVRGLMHAKGMVACAIVDEENRRVVLFRDAVGKKPLFIARWGGQVLFGSSLLPLVAVSDAIPEIPGTSAERYWKNEFIGPLETVFAGAVAVPPGTAITLDFDGQEIARARIPPKSETEPPPADICTARRRLKDLLELSVQRRLQDNPSPCLLLSGGIDSTVIATLLKKEATYASAEPLALSLGAVIPLLNDERYARFAARRIGLRLCIISAAPFFSKGHDIADRVSRALSFQDEPLGMISYFARQQLIERVRETSKIVLTGDGADEVALGYEQTARWQRSEDQRTFPAETIAGPPLPPWMSDWGRALNGISLLGHNFAVLDRASAEQGVEARCPYMDWDVMAYLRGLPPHILLAGGHSKSLLRGLLADWPNWFVNRRKIGFALNLRWSWAMTNFSGCRELVERAATERFAQLLPLPLRKPPDNWSLSDIFRNFPATWKLLAWSAFERRLAAIRSSLHSVAATPRQMATT